jgi:hypothetical protein
MAPCRLGFGQDRAALQPTVIIFHHIRSPIMKRSYLSAAPLALALALGSFQSTSMLRAQSQSQPDAQQDQQKERTFVGKIVKAKNGMYALLTDEQAGKGVYLDDQEKVKAFEGKSVKVTGVLEVAKNLVHVTDIQPA